MKSVQTILNDQYQLIQTERIRFLNNPYSAERVHDLRVAIRALRGLLKFLKRRLPPATFTDLDQTLGQAAQLFGPLREIDVLIDKAGDYAYAHPEAQPQIAALFEDFHDKRRQEMQRVLAESVQQRLTSDLDRVREALRDLNLDSATGWSAYVLKEFRRRYQKLKKKYRQVDFNDYARVHQIRKKAKTLRYSATYFNEFAPKLTTKVGRHAEKIQNKSGTITDAHVNDDLLRKFAAQTTNPAEAALLLRIATAQRAVIDAQK
ncbi:hypothetical protein YK48G_08010 [Lentilactobacillus fungorum]|uniref:CHAD domain-containing protein n=1 Tax=Lentilactobacillus fungorum TaxID=2201250 RepID=A0ABQ3VZD3_9LACO|nr:CHAD domain-containing protein [Lentilactobacillus fungorum]GHP13376.1 hypothetical protein YK48G_08010 [Lentilactobacillus fungorum]